MQILVEMFNVKMIEKKKKNPKDIVFLLYLSCFEPQREKTYLVTCGPNEDSNQPAHPRSLIRVFVVRLKKLCILGYPKCAMKILIRLRELHLQFPIVSFSLFFFVSSVFDNVFFFVRSYN